MSKISINVKVGQTLQVGGATIQVEDKAGKYVRLSITADPSIEITPPNKAAKPLRKSATQAEADTNG